MPGCDPQISIEQLGVAEPAPELSLKTTNRVQILWCARVLVRRRRKPRKRCRDEIREPYNLPHLVVGGGFASDNAGPRMPVGSRQPQIPRESAPGVRGREEQRRSLAGSESPDRPPDLVRQIRHAMRLDESDRAGDVLSAGQWTIDH